LFTQADLGEVDGCQAITFPGQEAWMNVHQNPRLTPFRRRELVARLHAGESLGAVAERLGVLATRRLAHARHGHALLPPCSIPSRRRRRTPGPCTERRTGIRRCRSTAEVRRHAGQSRIWAPRCIV